MACFIILYEQGIMIKEGTFLVVKGSYMHGRY